MDDTIVRILGNSPKNISLKDIYGDLQEYEKTIKIENYEIEITKRLFVDYVESLIDEESYLKVKGKIYKIMKVKEYSDYMEIWLYELKGQVNNIASD